jgi:hypothetical protein
MGVRAAIAIAVCAAFAPGLSASASPWNRTDGGLFVASRFDYFWSTTPVSAYSRYGTDTYAEFGVTPNWMLSGKVYYGTAISDSGLGRFTRTRFGESEFAVQRQLLRGPRAATAVSISGAWSERLADGTRVAFVDSNVDAEVRALHGREVVSRPLRIFSVAEIAYRRRFGDAADQARADLLIGFEPASRLLFLAEARTQISLGNEGVGGDDFDVVKARGSIVWRAAKKWRVVAGAEKEFAISGITPGMSVILGAWSEF